MIKYIDEYIILEFMEKQELDECGAEYGQSEDNNFCYYYIKPCPPPMDTIIYRFYDFDINSYVIRWWGSQCPLHNIDITEYINFIKSKLSPSKRKQYVEECKKYWNAKKDELDKDSSKINDIISGI